MGTGVLSAGVKRSGREANHSSPYSDEVKNEWSCTSTTPYVFLAWCVFKYWHSFTCKFHVLAFRFGFMNTEKRITDILEIHLLKRIVVQK
jgi:hypothetical protein